MPKDFPGKNFARIAVKPLSKKCFCFQQKYFFSSRKFCPGFCMRYVLAFTVGFVTMKNQFLNPVKNFYPVGNALERWRVAPPPHGTRRPRLPLCTGCLRHSEQGKSGRCIISVTRYTSQARFLLDYRAAGALYTAYNARHREPMGRRGAGVASGGMSYRVGVTFAHVCARIRTREAIFRTLHLATCHVWQSHMPGYGLQC